MSAPVAIVTGGSGGIGRWIARGLARAGHRTIIVGRDEERLARAADWIAAQVPGAAITWDRADLSSLAATRDLALRLRDTWPRIAVLVTNAGVFLATRQVTVEGHEKVLATNHLSPFLLTHMLLPSLRAHGAAQIVAVGSDTSDRARIDPADLELTRGWNFVRAYGRSKLAQMMTTFELAERLQGTGVTANVVHPGAVATGLVRTRGVIGWAWKAMAPFLLTEEQGADTPLYVATSADVAGVGGRYFKQRRIAAPNRRALDPVLRRAVWDATEERIGACLHP